LDFAIKQLSSEFILCNSWI